MKLVKHLPPPDDVVQGIEGLLTATSDQYAGDDILYVRKGQIRDPDGEIYDALAMKHSLGKDDWAGFAVVRHIDDNDIPYHLIAAIGIEEVIDQMLLIASDVTGIKTLDEYDRSIQTSVAVGKTYEEVREKMQQEAMKSIPVLQVIPIKGKISVQQLIDIAAKMTAAIDVQTDEEHEIEFRRRR